jgi:uncharacterized membrane protein (UPF0182 family)
MVLGATFAIVTFLSGFWTDWQWYASVDHGEVFTKQLILKTALFFIVGGFTAFVVWLSATLAHRSRPMDGWMSPESVALHRYREGLDPVRRALFFAGSLFFGALVGLSAASQWQSVVLWRNASPFGSKDAQFGKDISFYMFDLPFYRFVIGFAFTIVIAALIANIFVHFIYGGFRSGGIKLSSSGARAHLMFFLGVISLLKAGAYFVDKFSLATKSDALMTGLRYTDVHALVPAKTLLTYIALATAILFFVSLVRPGWSLPFIAFGVMLGASFLLGGLYPSFVQQVQVKPSELQRETPYIQRNLDATRAAYGLKDVKISEYQAIDDPSIASTSKDAGTLSNVRLLDPSLVSPTFRNLQQIRGFYAFPDSLDIDRYAINNVKRGTVIAVREVNLAGVADSQRNWFNDHMVFTHGYGAVAAYENTASADGAPSFFESNVPPSGPLNITEPRVYFGEQSPSYSIVGSPSGGEPRELDYPDDKSANGQTNNTYAGKGGVAIGNFFQRLLFAVHYQEPNILLSNQLSSSSKILYTRDPATRIKKVAPWLTLDSDPYPAVVDGKIQWIIDGYTTSNDYPYAARLSLSDVTADSVNAANSATQLSSGEVTYIRNSVKATVDAYDGTIHIYAWDANDPVLKAWSKVFPGVIENKSAMPAGILEHVRYPEDLFKVQRNVLAKYHVPDAQSFYSGQDFWNIPDDPTKPTVKQAQPPYFLTLRMPDQKAPSFQLTTAFAPNKRQTLAAFMSANSDPGPDYGTIRVLQLPRNTTIPGPTQVQNNFESDPEVSKQLSLLRSGGSDVELGNLLSLPVAGGLLYFEPVYVRASGADGYPLLRKVLVSFGSKVAFEDDLKTALVKVFSDQNAGGPSVTPTGTTPEEELAAALIDANKAYSDGQAALAKGDFAAYGVAQKRLEAALTRATQAGGKIAGTKK